MDSAARCLSQIQAIRNVAVGDAPPYVARSRIGRLATSAGSLAAEAGKVSAPCARGRVEVPANETTKSMALVNSVNRLRDLARHVAQPSEPLDGRWQRAWGELLEQLSRLEGCIKDINGNNRAT